MLLPFWNIFTRDKNFWESCRVAHAFVDKHVDKAIQRSSSEALDDQKFNLAHKLAKETNDRAKIRQQLLNMFLPAHDAIAIPLTNIFFNLARHPAVWRTLREEVLAIGSEEITVRRLKGLSYLQSVISETFRLYPGVGTNERVALCDTILPAGGGPAGKDPILIKKGDTINLNFYSLQRREDIWGPDAEEFRPERWKTARPDYWMNLPFGGGPRICPGQQLGLTQTAYIVARILQAFKGIENRDPVERFEDLYRVVTVTKNGAKVALTAA